MANKRKLRQSGAFERYKGRTGMIERELPKNIEAEQAVLGAMMFSKDAILTAAEILRDEDFYREAHRVFFRTILKMADEDSPVDLVTATERLRKDGWLEKVGGITFVAYVANCVPTAANIGYHAKIVKEMALLRRLIETGTEMICSSYESRDEVEEILDKAQAQIFSIASAKDTRTFSSMKELLLNAFQRVEKLHEAKGGLAGLSTGFRPLDKLTYGLTPSDFIIVAARPSMGKTAFALNVVTYVAMRLQKSVAFFSLEMSGEQLTQRILCAEARVDSGRMQTGTLEDEDWDRMIRAGERLSQAQLYIDDTASLSVMELRTKARRLKAEQGLDLIVIDYLQQHFTRFRRHATFLRPVEPMYGKSS